MPVSRDLQNMVADVSAAIAGKQSYGRADLEVLRRKLEAAARDAGEDERAGFSARTALGGLCDAIDDQVRDLAGLARRARQPVATQ